VDVDTGYMLPSDRGIYIVINDDDVVLCFHVPLGVIPKGCTW
jgi:hypothetical protein